MNFLQKQLAQTGYLQSADSVPLFYRYYEAKDKRATILLIHGLGEHSGRYGHVVEKLRDEGFTVWCLDLRGHGNSYGVKGDIKQFSSYEDDVFSTIKYIQPSLKKGEKLFILAHSMGALISLRMMAKHHPTISGLVLSSPLFALKFPVPKWKMKAVFVAADFIPSCRVKTGITGAQLSRDRTFAANYDEDPLVLKSLSVRAAREIFKGYQNTDTLADNISSAFFLQLAGNDPVVDPKAARGWFDRAAKNKVDATLKVYPDSLHEIYNEIDRDQAINDAISWLKKH